jgi:hypothetical protein
MVMTYEGNPKHREPWQPGRKGSLCPRDITTKQAQELLLGSVQDGNKRYGTLAGKAFCAHQHDVTKDLWHGHPVAWVEVPGPVIRQFKNNGLIANSDISRYWESTT